MAFIRYVEAIIGPKGGEGLKIAGLRITFSIEKTKSTDPNKGKIRIYNLSEDTSNKISISGNHLTLKAGYEDESVAAIFFGDVLKGEMIKEGTDFYTELEVFDGRSSIMEAPASVSYEKGTDAKTIAQGFIDAIGMPVKGMENIPGEVYDHGYSYIGMAGDGLMEVLNRYDLAYTIQNEMLFIIKKGEEAENTGLKLSAETGLLTTPRPISDKTGVDDEEAAPGNGWKFQAMLFPQLLPGAACVVESSTLNSQVLIDKAVFTGDSWTGDYRIDIEAEVV